MLLEILNHNDVKVLGLNVSSQMIIIAVKIDFMYL